MTSTIVIDSAGRVVLPKKLRDELRIGPGDSLELESDGDRVTLRPSSSETRLRQKDGSWVYRGGSPIPAELTGRVLRDIRQMPASPQHLGL